LQAIFGDGGALPRPCLASGGLTSSPNGEIMPLVRKLRLKARREKLFGEGRSIPLDREAKIRVLHRGKALMKSTEPGKAYGRITAKAFSVLEALLYRFHNSKTGRCFPSYEKIAEIAVCARSTVHEAILMLESAGILTWHQRLIRIRQTISTGSDPSGVNSVIRVLRTSNAYRFLGESSKSEKPTETRNQVLPFMDAAADSPLKEALKRLGMAIRNGDHPKLA
jgi:hypothetical protein